MQKTDVKATKLMIGNVIEIGGERCRITRLFHHFGRKNGNRVIIHAHPSFDRANFMNLNVAETARFTIFVTKKK